MRLHLLGISGPFPPPDGATSGYLLEAGAVRLQMDCGTGVLSRLTGICPPEDLDAILLTHWHFDHTSDLLPLIYRLEALGAVLPVYAPADEASALRAIVSHASCFNLNTIAPGDCFSIGDAVIRVGESRHPVPAVCYRVAADEKALVYTGDTNTLPSLTSFCQGCDLLVADGLFPAEDWTESKPHLSAELAAGLARDAEAAQLVLTHLNPLIDPARLLRQAREIFRNTVLAEEGMVISL